MKKVLALICALVLMMGYAVCESQVSPEEPAEIVETIEEPIVEAVEEAPPEEVLETFSEQPPEEPVVEIVEEPVVEESTVEVIEEPTVEVIEEPTAETPVAEEPIEKVEEKPVVEEIVAETIEPNEEPSDDITSDAVEFEEDDWGEITIEFKREVYISFLREPKHLGDTVTLVATLVNFKPDDQYTISWQYSIDGTEWISIEGEDERTYTFILDEVNCQYSYRALVNVEE